MQDRLPLSIPSKTTYYVLQLNPKIYEGLYEQSNEGSDSIWWPRKPTRKNERPLDAIYICQFTNYGSKALLDVATIFDLTFYSVEETQGVFKKNPNGTSSLSVTLPERQIPGTPNPGIRRMAFSEEWHGKVTAITPGDVVSTHKHRAVIPVIPAGGSAAIYLVNESKLFAHFSFPTTGESIVTGDPKKQTVILIRPDVNFMDKIPDTILLPSSYHWTGVPDAPYLEGFQAAGSACCAVSSLYSRFFV